jgi:hypothetical protein
MQPMMKTGITADAIGPAEREPAVVARLVP